MFTWNLNHFHHKHTKLNKMAMNNWSTDERCRWEKKAWSPNSTSLTFSGCSVFRARHVIWTSLITFHIVTWQLFIDRLPSLKVHNKINDSPDVTQRYHRHRSRMTNIVSNREQFHSIQGQDHWHESSSNFNNKKKEWKKLTARTIKWNILGIYKWI